MKRHTIRVSDETRDALKKIGHKGDTYNDVIRNLIEVASLYAKGTYIGPPTTSKPEIAGISNGDI